MIRDGVYVCGGGGRGQGQGQGTLDIPDLWDLARSQDRSEDGGPDSHITITAFSRDLFVSSRHRARPSCLLDGLTQPPAASW